MTFNGELHKIEIFEEKDIARFTIHIQTMTKDIREEVDVITTSGLIGSIGGSLGMFFGFSFSGYALYLLDKCVSIFMTKLPQSDKKWMLFLGVMFLKQSIPFCARAL